MSESKIPVVAVVGPTASGKSRLAVDLALKKNGEIVSADSMQIYRHMQIGTAKPTIEERRGVAHHLIDFLEPDQPFSVADFVEKASACIRDIFQRGKLPIVAGGTGLYVRSLLHNIRFSTQSGDAALRGELTRRAEKEGGQALLDELRSFDPQSAQRLHPHNIHRIVRAIEIYRTTGVTMTEQLAQSRKEESPYQACILGLTYANRQELYRRIDERVDEMMKNGLVEEAKTLLPLHLPTARQAIGYKELIPYFHGDCTLEQAVDQIKKETRHYAKRQLTWFRREEGIHWVEAGMEGGYSRVAKEALDMVELYLKR